MVIFLKGMSRKMLNRAPHIVFSLVLILVTSFSQGNSPDRFSYTDKNTSYQTADSLYTIGNFDSALKNFKDVSEDKLFNRDPNAQFKMAYTYYKTGDYKSSATIFRKLLDEDQYLTEYSEYFYIKSLWPINNSLAVDKAVEYINKYKKHALSDSMIVPLADELFEIGSFKKARNFYLMAKKRKINPDITVYSLVQAAYSLYYLNKEKQAFSEFYQIIRKYPGRKETLELVANLKREEPKFYQENFFSIADVYYKNGRYSSLRLMLEKFIKAEKNPEKKERARYNLLRIYISQKRYQTALYGLKNLLKNLKNNKLEPHIRLNIARTYYKMGWRKNAIDAYLDYADRYPRRRIAPETVWKAAWINEELSETENALKLYRDLRKRWKGSRYGKEAYFREGFTLYRLGRYKEADQVFTEIRLKRWPDIHVNRAYYWSSLCRDIKGDSTTARRLRLNLAENLWDDYYTMKSYLIHKSHIDTSWNMIEAFKKSANAFNYYGNGMSKLLKHFDIAFQVRELLGESYGFAALSDIKLRASSWEEWMALAEIYKKFGAYNKAFRIYDLINYKYFGDKSYVEKAFMLKERFPYYYDDIVEKYSRRYNLEQELVLGLIKQESLYDPNAHSWANAYGLMQLMPPTAGDMAKLARMKLRNIEVLFQPDVNIHLGSLYLKQLNRQFKGDKEFMLAAYNAGPHRVKRWRTIPGSDQVDVFIENIEYSETRGYVRNVMKNYWAYKLLSNNFNIEQEQIIYGALDANTSKRATP